MATNSLILWGRNSDGTYNYENQLLFGRPGYNMITDRVPRPPSQSGQGPSGIEDAFIVGRDYTLWITNRWIPDGNADVTMSPLSGPLSWQAFFDYARDKNPFRFVPDATYPAFYVDGCYLVDPLGKGPLGSLDDVIQRDIPYQIRNPSVDFHQALRGLMLEYAPQGDYTALSPLPTFSRASVASFKSSILTPTQAASGVLRDRHYHVAGQRVTLLEPASTNLVLQSANFGTTWTASGTPTRTPAAIVQGIVTLDLIGDDSAAAVEYYFQNIVFTGDAVKAVSIYLYPGTIQAASGSRIQLVDTTASASRLVANVTGWTGSVPTVAMTTGTYFGFSTTIAGLARLLFQTTSVTAAHTNELDVQPARVLGEQGNLYAGGVQAENAPVPTSYIPTTTGTVTRAIDNFTIPLSAALQVPQGMWLYVKFVELGTALTGATTGLLGIGDTGTPSVYIFNDGSGHYALEHDSGASVSSIQAAGPVYGDTVELLALLYSDGSVQLLQSINGAATTAAARSAANAFGVAWATSALRLGARTASTTSGPVGIIDVRCGSGTIIATIPAARAA